MDHQRPDHKQNPEHAPNNIELLAAAAEEYLVSMPQEERSPFVTSEAVAHIITFMADSQPHAIKEIRQLLFQAVPENQRLRMREIEQALDVAERVLFAEGTYVVWRKLSKAQDAEYKFEAQAYDEPLGQLLETMQIMQEPITTEALEEVFGPRLRSLFKEGLTVSVPAVVAQLRHVYNLPQFLIEPCIYAFQEVGLARLERHGRRTLLVLADSHDEVVAETAPGTTVQDEASGAPAEPKTKPEPPEGVVSPSRVRRTKNLPPTRSHRSTYTQPVSLAAEYETRWQENRYRELAVIAAKRLAWHSARAGVSTAALYVWMDADGVNESMKSRVLEVLQQNEIVIQSTSDEGSMVKLRDGLRDTEWLVVENTIRRIF